MTRLKESCLFCQETKITFPSVFFIEQWQWFTTTRFFNHAEDLKRWTPLIITKDQWVFSLVFFLPFLNGVSQHVHKITDLSHFFNYDFKRNWQKHKLFSFGLPWEAYKKNFRPEVYFNILTRNCLFLKSYVTADRAVSQSDKQLPVARSQVSFVITTSA